MSLPNATERLRSPTLAARHNQAESEFMPPKPTDKQPPSPPCERPGRVEWAAILAVVVCGVAARTAAPGRMAVEHFDEGVYASNVWSGEDQGFRYPFQHLYAPPLLPALIEFCVMLFGPTGVGPMLVNIAVGSLTVVLLWRVGRAWFGPTAGLTAAALCAFSDFHILYSRTALTDPLLSLGMLAAVYCIWRTHRDGDARWGLAAALAAGTAWWAKYNGWLPLAVGISGVVVWQIFTPMKRRAIARHVAIWAGIATVAFGVWSPVWFGLQSEGGYAAVAENHRQYLVGLSGWADSFVRHVAVHRFLDGWLTCVGTAVAATAAALMAQREQPVDRLNTLTVFTAGLAACGLATATGSAAVFGVLACIGIVLQTGVFQRGDRARAVDENDGDSARRLAAWLLAAWFFGLLLTTPLYRPYPRLGLPWLVATWLGCGAFAEFTLRWWIAQRQRTGAAVESKRSPNFRRSASVAGMSVAGLTLLALFGSRLTQRGVPGWQRRDGFVEIADEVVDRASTSGNAAKRQAVFVVYVYGEPGLYYQLTAAASRHPNARYVVAPISSLEFSAARSGGETVPTFLALGPHADRTVGFNKLWQRQRHRFEAVGDPLPYRASDLVLLNEYAPAEIANPESRPALLVRMYRLRR